VLADLQRYVTVTQASERFRGIPFPGTFMLDRQARVTARFFEDYYWERNTVSNVLRRVGGSGSPVEAVRASTAHLAVIAYASDQSVSLGTRFSLAADVTPNRGMHVYAPGATGYRVVNLTVDPVANVRMTPIRYGPSEMYYFKPLNERVPVYQKAFTLVLDVIPEATPEARKALAGTKELAFTGTVEYQACDDKVCYNPTSLPLSWRVALRESVSK